MAQDDVQLKIRVPQEVKDWLTTQTDRYASSLGSEVVRCIRREMDRELNKTETAGSAS